MNRLTCSIAAASALLLAGCATTQRATWTPTGDALTDGRTAIAQGPAKDKMLWQYRTAVTAMRRGNLQEAKQLLDDAILTLGGIQVGDKSAKKARRLFSAEESKNFIGEPYERSMAYFYRGILYWMDGEPDNARACFRSAQFEDSDLENSAYSGDYVLFDYLDALITAKLGGDAADVLKRARASVKNDAPPEINPKANTLVFLEFGQGPTKYAAGEFNEQLRIRPGNSVARGAIVSAGGKTVRVGAHDDVSYQATTRGGRVMDHILANKAVFKSTTDNIGNAAIISGMAVGAADRRNSEVALGLAAFGVLSKIVSASTTPRADTRTWDNLPQYISFAALQLPPGTHEVTVDFFDGGGNVIPSRSRKVSVNVPSTGNDVVIFASDRI
ncbi:MAG TPA: hypothetical protein VEH27_19030 [Methylomirabilota bacterium]|nr:hypothetical protein [Methylomirabilota bacterium]